MKDGDALRKLLDRLRARGAKLRKRASDSQLVQLTDELGCEPQDVTVLKLRWMSLVGRI